MTSRLRAAIYARVSTLDQEPENQLADLRQYVTARGWVPFEYVDHGVSGAKEHRPALDRLIQDARRRRIDVLVCWRLDRLGRNLKHLVTLLDELQALGVAFVSLNEGIEHDTRRSVAAPHPGGPGRVRTGQNCGAGEGAAGSRQDERRGGP